MNAVKIILLHITLYQFCLNLNSHWYLIIFQYYFYENLQNVIIIIKSKLI